MCDLDEVITLGEAARRCDPESPPHLWLLVSLCRNALPVIPVERDTDASGTHCMRTADLPRLEAELARWRTRPRRYPVKRIRAHG